MNEISIWLGHYLCNNMDTTDFGRLKNFVKDVFQEGEQVFANYVNAVLVQNYQLSKTI